MKKLLAVLLVMAMVVSMAACGKQESGPDAAYNNYLKEIQKGAKTGNGTLTVAMSPDFAPMEFYDLAKKGDDAIVGFDVLLANFLATPSLGRKYDERRRQLMAVADQINEKYGPNSLIIS